MTQTTQNNEHIRRAAELVAEKANARIERLQHVRTRLDEADPGYVELTRELEEAERAVRLASAAAQDLEQSQNTPQP